MSKTKKQIEKWFFEATVIRLVQQKHPLRTFAMKRENSLGALHSTSQQNSVGKDESDKQANTVSLSF